ncbi:MAG TPA: hypothetical protein PKU80_05800 [Candidatus Limiplasma sp.]|nr:hypothetical protein [Candidatus Limiplasma sp.]HRX08575.1 hypothetical protein [Candidatus Limiplasma sp.]
MKKALAIAALVIAGLVLCAGCAVAEAVISSILVDEQQTFSESKYDMEANGGQNIALGDGNGSMKMVNEGLMLIAPENENPMFNLVKRLDEAGGTIDGNQALHIRFKSSTKDFGIMLFAQNSAGMTIGDNNEPLAFVNFGEYMEPLSGHLFLQPGKWYHALLAMRWDGVMQIAVWLEEEASNLAGGYVDIGSAFGEGAFQNQSWEASLGVRGNATFIISNYEYLTFSGFVMDYRSLETDANHTGDMPNDMDYGPSWTFDIADGFDVISDSVWMDVAPQHIDAAGDTYMGYNLADLMNFSGNGWDMATVTFRDDNASSVIVKETYDAFIVYQRNGEFLGGPYLLSDDGLSEYPVAQVFRFFAIPWEEACVISTVISNWQTTYEVLKQDLIADNGASFRLDDPENHHVILSTSDEGITFEAEGMSNPQMSFEQRLSVEGTLDHKQAAHVLFKPSGANFSFSLWANFGLWIEIGSQNEPYLHLLEKNYQQAFEGDFRVEPGMWHHLLVALTPDGVLQAAMWKDGEEGNVAYLNLDLFQSFNEPNYQSESWQLCLSVAQQETMTLGSYEYITFEGFATEGKVVEIASNDMQDNNQSANDNDFGPEWKINIADNFEVVYNTIMDIKRPQIVSVAGGEYLGYTLWDLLELSDNASGVATVWFNGDGENNTVVSPTYDAFIVFAIYDEWEWLGAPYLITIDGLWPDPVTDVYP